MRTLAAVAMLASVVLPVPGFAAPDPGSDATRMVTGDCARARKAGKTCVLDVAPEDVDGQAPAAGEIGTQILVFATEGSLLRLRRDFILEIVKTAEDL